LSALGPRNAEPWLRDPAVAERSGSRESIDAGFRHRVSRGTVCSLGQPNKAIGLESQIEPWLAIATTLLAGAKKPHGTTQRSMGSCSEERNTANTLQQRVVQPHTGAGCQGTSSSPAKGKVFPLDIPFYRTPGFFLCQRLRATRVMLAPEMSATRLVRQRCKMRLRSQKS
jgi:hypothetical protein